MKKMTVLGEVFAALRMDRRSDSSRRASYDRRNDGVVRVPLERRRIGDRRQLIGRRDGEHRPLITDAELKALLGH